MHTLLCTCTTFTFTENKVRIKKMSHTAAHRHGMVFVDDDHGEYESQRHSSGSDESFHSEGEDIAEYWDPYRESDRPLIAVSSTCIHTLQKKCSRKPFIKK